MLQTTDFFVFLNDLVMAQFFVRLLSVFLENDRQQEYVLARMTVQLT